MLFLFFLWHSLFFIGFQSAYINAARAREIEWMYLSYHFILFDLPLCLCHWNKNPLTFLRVCFTLWPQYPRVSVYLEQASRSNTFSITHTPSAGTSTVCHSWKIHLLRCISYAVTHVATRRSLIWAWRKIIKGKNAALPLQDAHEHQHNMNMQMFGPN